MTLFTSNPPMNSAGSRIHPEIERDLASSNASLSSRKTRIGKSISPGALKGSLEITLLYRNKADFLRENVVINEFVPGTFSIIGSNNKYGTANRDGGTMISWLLDKVNPDEEVEIHYAIKAEEGSSSLKHPECLAFK
jgi:hypothetical protein